jgi:hypothetical protein
MANTGFLSVSDISFDGIKANLKTYLQNQAIFQDYDFEGSNLNALLDLLSYNTYMNSFYLNMVGSEMFLDSAQLRASIVSHAKELNYLPRSSTSSKAQVRFTVNTGGDTPPYVIVPKGYIVRTTVDNVSLDFSTAENVIILNNNGIYVSDPVYVYEGKLVTEFFNVVNTTSFPLSSNNVDTNSIEVTVINSSTDSTNTAYSYASNVYGLNSNSTAFFIDGYKDYQYQVVFGDGVFGKALSPGNIVKVNYRSTNGELGNKAYTFSSTTKVANVYPVTVTTSIVAADGSGAETDDSIRLNAPKHYAAQNRAVTKEDYTTLILENYPQIQAVNVYGGEDADPPQYGKVIISLIPYGSAPIVATELKNDIISFLSSKSITIKPVIEDPEYIFVEINSNVTYDPSLTAYSSQFITTEVINQISNYETTYMSSFGDSLRKSKLTSFIDSSDPSIISNQTELRMIYKITPTRSATTNYDFTFGNALNRTISAPYSSSETEVVRSDLFSYLHTDNNVYQVRLTDDGMGNLRLYYLTSQSIQVVLVPNLGTVNYATGEMIFSLKPWDYTNSINIFAITLNDDISVTNSKYLKIDYSNVFVSVAPAS